MSDYKDDDVLIASVVRTPIGRARKGSLVSVRADDLAVQAVSAALAAVPEIPVDAVEDLYLGCAEPEDEQGQNMARRVAVLLGQDRLPGATVTRFCASSLQALRMAFHAVRAGEGDVFVAAGVESVSRYVAREQRPHPAFEGPGARARQQAEGDSWVDPRMEGELPDVYVAMGLTAEFVARRHGVGREDQDALALRSQRRAAGAIASGLFAREIVPVRLTDGTIVDADDSPRPATTREGLAALPPAFVPHGTVTAGNACPLNDGASAAVVVSGRTARATGLVPRARILSSAVAGVSPEIMGMGPVPAIQTALDRAGARVDDIDVFEINEAFASQVVASQRALGIDDERLNPLGGAIALGHPFGATGVRMVGTLLNGLSVRGGTLGVAGLCIGGGQGMAVVIEAL
ncbi:acetyl-CoA C-acyltransferase [Microbacterium sp. SORGH_AS_0888]|uniref:acetyl-CoA C-acyltransferase n=1 Tax=Microbacterium sp. SORGH_AS_0888 TaxID=3041791 RepID=UPI00278873B7|nr:acetyl-CoA C-acyltransferase [Microbacterium sp. SORGH_AS_0888]MDQ1131017.1 acetyl-CoA C-acetyltransferase [Microbacterium sp. SORGH_AS_0888]